MQLPDTTAPPTLHTHRRWCTNARIVQAACWSLLWLTLLWVVTLRWFSVLCSGVTEGRESAMAAINGAVTKVYRQCGFDPSSNPSTLTMMAAIEVRHGLWKGVARAIERGVLEAVPCLSCERVHSWAASSGCLR